LKTRPWPRSGYLLFLGALLAGLGLLISPRVLGSQGVADLAVPLSLTIGAAGGLLILVAMVGLALAPGQPASVARRNYGSHVTVVGLTLMAGAGTLAALLPAVFTAPGARTPAMLAVMLLISTAVLDLLLVGITYFRVVRPGIISWADMGLTRLAVPLSWQVGPMAFLGLLVLTVAIELPLKALGIQQTQLESLDWVRAVPPAVYALVAFAAAVMAPIAEEIYFRGYVFRAYLEQKGPLQAYVFSSLLFALVHLNLQAVLPIFIMGLFLAYLYRRTGSIIPGMVAHAMNNAVAFSALYFFGS
jgi:membrane protease YdiL (CAAX protease family)